MPIVCVRPRGVSTSLDTNGYLGHVQDMRTLLVSTLVAASLMLGGCGLRPLYANGSKGAVAQVLADVDVAPIEGHEGRSEEHTSELQSLMRTSYAVCCLKKKRHTCTPSTSSY